MAAKPSARLKGHCDPPRFHQDRDGRIHINWTEERVEEALKIISRIIARRVVEKLREEQQRSQHR